MVILIEFWQSLRARNCKGTLSWTVIREALALDNTDISLMMAIVLGIYKVKEDQILISFTTVVTIYRFVVVEKFVGIALFG